MINCKEDLYGTYIENDNGELRNLYLSKCQEFGLNINSACYVTRSALIFAKEGFGRFGNVDHAEVLDFITSKHGITKELTLSDLKPVIEWKNGDDIEVRGNRYKYVGLYPFNENLCICLANQDSDIQCFSVDEIKKPESPEEKKKREREENAIAYFNFETKCFHEAGENDQLLTDSWEQANSVAKEAYRIMAEKLNFKAN